MLLPNISLSPTKYVSDASLNVVALTMSAKFPNSTVTRPPGTAGTAGTAASGCGGQCWRDYQPIDYIQWIQMPITATVTAETLLFIVNNRTNSTRTSTIYNTDLNLADYTSPTTTNSAGTVTTSVVLRVGSTNSTRIV